MLCPLELEQPLTGNLHKQEPLELHWRHKAPTCRGNIEKAYYRAYPDLAQEVLCFQCGAIPCPYNHDDTDKKQRLTDLDFIKELAQERREMKEELKKMGEKMSELKQHEDTLVLDKQVLSSKVETYEKMEEEWKHTKLMLDAEIRRLKLLNEQNKEILCEFKKDQLRLKYIEQKLEDAELENQRLKAENERCIKRLYSQSAEIENLTKQNEVLTKELETSKAKVKKLIIQIEVSKDELQKANEQLKEKDAKIIKMEIDMKNLIAELTEKTQIFEQKETKFEALIKELREVMDNLKQTNKESEDKIKELLHMIQLLQEEVEMLKRKLASDTRFKQFVDIKRECNTLKDVSGVMAQKLQTYENKTPLPVVKKSGKVTKKSKAFGPGARPASSILNRPTSARVLVKVTDDLSSAGPEFADLDDFDDESRPGSSQFNRPMSGRSQFRSPTIISCSDDAELYVLNEDSVSRPNSGFRRSMSARYPSRSSQLYDPDSLSPSQNSSRPTSRIGSASLNKKTISPAVDNASPMEVQQTDSENQSQQTPKYINRDTLSFTLDDISNQQHGKKKLHSTPASTVGSESDFGSFQWQDGTK